MTFKIDVEVAAEQDPWRNKMFPCDKTLNPPGFCDSWGVCNSCCEALIFDIGFKKGAEWACRIRAKNDRKSS
jgi:hypothetical protein